MQNKIFVLNVIYAITELIVCVLCLMAFAWGANHFGKWWLLLFCLLPVALYANHGVLLEGEPAEEVKKDA